jgi:hypothetical protein
MVLIAQKQNKNGLYYLKNQNGIGDREEKELLIEKLDLFNLLSRLKTLGNQREKEAKKASLKN